MIRRYEKNICNDWGIACRDIEQIHIRIECGSCHDYYLGGTVRMKEFFDVIGAVPDECNWN